MRMTIARSSHKSKRAQRLVAVVLSTLTVCGALLSSTALAADADDDQAKQSKAAPASNSGPPAPAPAAVSAAPLEEVTVTGTRIRRKDLDAISPLVTVDAEQLENRAGLNIESYLDQMPQYNVAQAPTTENVDVQASPINTVGVSTISLRGFGPNRSLVLIDGHRTTPVNALMETDINTIPSSMIDHIETISGGASAVYGADAIGGVTNFILKKNFQGAQLDVQDGVTQYGDGNELRVNAIMGTAFVDDKGHITMGVEYYDRQAAYQKNRSFYTDSWYDPNVGGSDFFTGGTAGYDSLFDAPSQAAVNAIFAKGAAAKGPTGTCSPFSNCAGNTFMFNPNGTLWNAQLPLSLNNYSGPLGTAGYAPVNELDPSELNSAALPEPDVAQGLKWNNPFATVESPQTRYSFFTEGTYDLTDDIQFYTNARFANSLTTTFLGVPPTFATGWEASVPYTPATDDPILPGDVTASTSQTVLNTIAADFAKYGYSTANPYYNPGYLANGVKGAQHPVPWQLAMLLDSRGAPTAPGTAYGNPVTCNPEVGNPTVPNPSSVCDTGDSSWYLTDYPFTGFDYPGRETTDTSQSWQIETGFRFPLKITDWTGELYYSRGQSTDYNVGYNDQSLERYRALIDSPDYGAGQAFQGNQTSVQSAGFGTSVLTTCTSGFYNQIFGGDQTVSTNCLNAIDATLQTMTEMQQDVVEANFQGTATKDWAGEISAALGYQYRDDYAIFNPDTLQATNSFIDQTVGVYPTGSLNQGISTNDAYLELYIPLVRDLPLLQKLDLDVGGRYSAFSADVPSATTFKVDLDASLTKSFRLRGGFNRANRAPNLGELYLNEQEFFGGGAQFGDPCSVDSTATFGAGGAAPDKSASGSPTGTPTKVVNSKGAVGANSTYLICQAQMGANAANVFYNTNENGAGFDMAALSAPAIFGWLNEEGNPTLSSETADTYTAGFVFSNLSDDPWLAGLSGSVDWWQFTIKHAIELQSPDEANYLCYGTVTVTTMAEAEAQAASPACQDVARSNVNGLATTSLLTYTNQASIWTSGIDFALNWTVNFRDAGIPLPGAFLFATQDTYLDYYKTRASSDPFDLTINWKGTTGPLLSGLNGGAYTYRLTASVGYVLPSVAINLRWTFYPSVNDASVAEDNADKANNAAVAAGAPGTIVSYVPTDVLGTAAFSVFDLSGNWDINKTFQLRAGINNLFNVGPPIQGATVGYLHPNSLCGANEPGCENQFYYVLPSDGAGLTNTGYYYEGVLGRTFFVGMKATF